MGEARILIRGEHFLGVGIVGSPGEPLGRRRIFENFPKISQENCEKALF